MYVDQISPEPFNEDMLSSEVDDATRLEYFLESVLDLLRIGAQSAFLLFELPVRSRWRAAIDSISDDRVTEVLATIRSLPFEPSAPQPGVGLDAVGLSGEQLHAKLTAYANARMRFHVRGGIGNLRRTVRWAKAILGSLTKAIPFAEFILELIEFVENGAADMQDLEQGRL